MTLAPPQEFRKTAGIHRTGLAASRPAAADVLVGTLYFSTDTGALERSTGSAWTPYASLITPTWTAVPYNAANFTHNGGMTWTVSSTVGEYFFNYVVIGHVAIVNITLLNSGLTGSSNDTNVLNITLPVTCATTTLATGMYGDSGGSGAIIVQANGGSPTLQCFKSFAAPVFATGTVHLSCQIIVPI